MTKNAAHVSSKHQSPPETIGHKRIHKRKFLPLEMQQQQHYSKMRHLRENRIKH